VFGRLISGQDTLSKITNVAVDANDRPLQPVLISRCGEFEGKGKQKHKQSIVDSAVSPDIRDRGRRRRSSSDVDISASPQPRPTPMARLQSNKFIDEGLRGGLRQHSVSHSPFQTVEESGESAPESATHIHKRKRSQSPSRHNAAHDETPSGQRRQ
jgi:peptidyl-prolyl isomerase G (cyclophilin G)